jgi:hypothetical protein
MKNTPEQPFIIEEVILFCLFFQMARQLFLRHLFLLKKLMHYFVEEFKK